MTTDALVPPPVYTISGTGPYAIPHAWLDQAEFGVIARPVTGADVELEIGVHYSLSAAGPVASGDLTLTASAAALFAGGKLVIVRETAQEQGFAGANAIDRGLERQLDRTMQAVQDVARLFDRTLRLPPGFAPGDAAPVTGAVLQWGANGTLVAAPAGAAADFEIAYSTRAHFLVAAAAESFAAGTVVQVEGLLYRYDGVSTVISDLEGWAPVAPVTPLHFAGDVTGGDWAPAFTAAFAAARVVHVPTGDYTFKSSAVFQQEGQALVGAGPIRPNAVQSGAGPRIVRHFDLGVNPMLHMLYSGTVEGVAFSGSTKGIGLAIRARKPTDYGEAYEDTDAEITNCSFDRLALAVEHWNRGLRFDDNNVSLCTIGVKLFGFDSDNFVDSPGNDFDDLPEGFRAIFINRNRFHAVDRACENEGLNKEFLRGFEMSENRIDIGDALFLGGLFSGRFSDNTVDQTSGAFAIQFTTAVNDVLISGNRFQGDLVQGLPTRFVQFNLGCPNVNISGNVFRGSSDNGIYHASGVLSGLITGNVFENIGEDATNACIRADTGGDFTNLAITGNYFNPNAGSICIRGATTGVTFTGVVVEGNAGNRSRTLISNFADGGGNLIQSW